ncbi:hypothetical protein IHE55_22020 [Streptomyces pactum]|uniref:Uncharacterized protein n=1 Tax=Streptomyces pactum TaxID=68249 RepID=A0ABS0NQ07_9ACTN|nr:hypothetical protein [Streptomyces pactum]MBH5337290.1 hypothetical protein [Streptomyces pactum]
MSRHEEPGDRRAHGDPDFQREVESLLDFKRQIDRIVADLGDSPAAQGEISRQSIVRSAFGQGFAAADDLAAAYDAVHRRLEKFSETLGEQLEALGIAVQIADRGYDGVEADQVERFRRLQKKTRDDYPELYETAPGTEEPEPAAQGTGDTAGAGGDFS